MAISGVQPKSIFDQLGEGYEPTLEDVVEVVAAPVLRELPRPNFAGMPVPSATPAANLATPPTAGDESDVESHESTAVVASRVLGSPKSPATTGGHRPLAPSTRHVRRHAEFDPSEAPPDLDLSLDFSQVR